MDVVPFNGTLGGVLFAGKVEETAVGLPMGSHDALGKEGVGRGVPLGKASGSAAVPREMQGTWWW